MNKFFDFLVRWSEAVYEANRESIIRTWDLDTISDMYSQTTAPVKPVKTAQSVCKLDVLEASNS
jgi:hypothetical protein